MKKKNWLLTIAFAVLSLTIISTCVIGSTYAKFTTNVEGGAKVQAAGFLVAGSQTNVNVSVGLVAPGVSQHKDATIEYFSQVVTDISVAQAGATITGTGVLDAVDPDGEGSEVSPWVAMLTAYKATTAGASDAAVTTSTTLADVFTITVGNGTALTLATDFAAAVATAVSTAGITDIAGETFVNTGAQLPAMAADADTTVEVTIPVTVTWTSLSNSFDTYLGNRIAELATDTTTPTPSYITVNLPIVAEQHVA